ncbi:uncharacterized protein LOC134537110 isoform X4 [Bacillus rossius redtenbacheri]|uniref:uncharacterized protein LOC134537110 isoform X4 n=1 Tax=Bacillus rossius redtenbacheri TaxID=93214 RepID=UPI002FDDA059
MIHTNRNKLEGGGKAWWLPARNKKERSSLSVNSVKQSYMQLTRVFSDDEAQINKKLPKELLLRIFSYLDVVSLCRCAQVSRAWNVLALDGSNWQRIDLFEFQKDVEPGKETSEYKRALLRVNTKQNWDFTEAGRSAARTPLAALRCQHRGIAAA